MQRLRLAPIQAITEEVRNLESLIGLVILLLIVGWIYSAGHKRGKREGSRKGYGVGFDRGRRAKSSGCLVLVVVAGLALAATTAVLACLL
jgi:hypothetical protein